MVETYKADLSLSNPLIPFHNIRGHKFSNKLDVTFSLHLKTYVKYK